MEDIFWASSLLSYLGNPNWRNGRRICLKIFCCELAVCAIRDAVIYWNQPLNFHSHYWFCWEFTRYMVYEQVGTIVFALSWFRFFTLLQISLPTWPATKLQIKLELQVWILDAPKLIGFEVHVLGMCYITCLLVLVQSSEFCGGKQQQQFSMQASNSSMFRWER